VIGLNSNTICLLRSYKMEWLCKDRVREDTKYFQLFTLCDCGLYLFIFIGNTERE
jgi:hypothetical protein